MMFLKKIDTFEGITIWNRGIITISCCVFIIDQSRLREAVIKMFKTKLEATINFELSVVVLKSC